MDAVLERFISRCPVAVMAHLTLRHAFDPSWIDDLFDETADRQYTRTLLFSLVVDIVALVALGLRPSLSAAARHTDRLTVSLTALYDKINHTEPPLLRALIRGNYQRLAPVVHALHPNRPSWLSGYRVRIFDGNHLPASEKRLKSLRSKHGAALPGFSLVVYDPETSLACDLLAVEDAHDSEKNAILLLMDHVQPGDLWVGDRAFCTRRIIGEFLARSASFILRETASYPNPTPRGEWIARGRCETGLLFEQEVLLPLDDGEAVLRRIEVRLDKPTQDGDRVLRFLTNLPAQTVPAEQIAALYRGRWSIEGMFQRLEASLASEVQTLGHPRAALLGFAVAVLAYNALEVVKSAIEAEHLLHEPSTLNPMASSEVRSEGEDTLPEEEPPRSLPEAPPPKKPNLLVEKARPRLEISLYHLAQEVGGCLRGMLIAIPEKVWKRFDGQSPKELARTLRRIGKHVRLQRYKKNPRGPKKPKPKETVSREEVSRHFATAQVLRDALSD